VTGKPTFARIPYDSYESGVKGGDITAHVGKYLIVLRQGYLFSVLLNEKDNKVLRTVSKVNTIQGNSVFAPWQRELVSSGNRIAVIGFSSVLSALEINLFELDASGNITHVSTHYISGCSFYSDAQTLIHQSRLLGEGLIVYLAAHAAGASNGGSCHKALGHAPRAPYPFMINKWGKQRLGQWEPLPSVGNFKAYKSTDSEANKHAILYCSFSGAFSCKVRTIQDDGFASQVYVSKNAVYLWSLQNKWNEKLRSYEAIVYKVPSRPSSEPILTLKTFGVVANQQSMYESKSGSFYAVVVSNLNDAPKPYQSELQYFVSTKSTFLYALKSDFTKSVSAHFQMVELKLPQHTINRRLQNRFTSDCYIYGTTWEKEEDKKAAESLYVVNLSSKKTYIIPLLHDVEEIKVIGNAVVVHGTSSKIYKGTKSNPVKLFLSSISIEGNPSLKSTVAHDLLISDLDSSLSGYSPISVRNALFYSPSLNAIALPLQFIDLDYKQYPYGMSQQLIYRISDDLMLKKLGVVTAPPQKVRIPEANLCNEATPHICSEAFYENSRLLDYGGRIFALMGNSILELEPNKMSMTSGENFFRKVQ
jgi:hypothetical protein